MNSHHVRLPTLNFAGIAALAAFMLGQFSSHCPAGSPPAQAASSAIVTAASRIPTADEVALAKHAEPAIEIRAAIPVVRTPQVAPPQEPENRSAVYAGHMVRRDETLESIAAQAGTPPHFITSYNRLSGPLLPGRQIVVPVAQESAPSFPSKPVLVERGLTNHPLVALTFDAGSTAEPLPKLLQTLRDHRLKVTFFVTGFWVRENPALLQQIVADGHELGNHSLSHPDMRKLDDMRVKHEILETERLVRNTAGVGTRPYFRPPYGAYNDHLLLATEALGYLPIYWTLDCLDSVGAKKTAEFIAERVTHKLSRDQMCGSIVLMHVDSMATADAVPSILSRFDQMGLRVVTLTELLNEGGTPASQKGLSSR